MPDGPFIVPSGRAGGESCDAGHMFADAGPTARALLALELLQNRPGITAEELGRRLEVSERAARRTIATLRDVGIPVESARGPHGGYRLGRGLRLPPLSFTATEALGLVMAVLDGHHAADSADEPVGAALGKLIAALPSSVGQQAALMREHAQAVPAREEARPQPGIAARLVAAVAEQRRVRLRYGSREREWDEVVDPWGVVVRHGRWYLVCHSHRAAAVRTYRLDRIVAADALDERFGPPVGLDVVEALESNLGQGWAHPTRVVVHAPLEDVAPWVGPAWGRLLPHPEDTDRCVIEGSTNNPTMYASEWLARLPFGFAIEGGPELKQAMRDVVARLSASCEPTATP